MVCKFLSTNAGRWIAGALLWLIAASMDVTAAAPRALVFDHADRWTTATGAESLLAESGFEVSSQGLSQPLALGGVDIVFLASFISEHPDYAGFMSRNKTALLQFVEAGGVVVQMTQADQTEASPPFLPESLEARRSDPDFAELFAVSGDHLLIEGLPGSNGAIDIPTHLDRGANWEALSQQSGFRVLLASDPAINNYALLEGASGSGRIILTSLFLDKIERDGQRIASRAFSAVASLFFDNLAAYVIAVRDGVAADVVPTRRPEPLPFVPGSWTIAVLPDTQNYSSGYPEVFEAQTRWIVENQEARNIVYALHLGDIVNNNTRSQWENAQRAMRILDDGGVPYAIVPGNHDYGDNGSANNRQTYFNEYFPIAHYRDWPTFGGAMDPERMDNTYHLFRAGNQDWLVLALEWGPRDPVVEWADSIVEQYPNHKAILITHAYMYYDETRYDWGLKGSSQSWNPYAYGTAQDPDGTNDGEDLWQKLVGRHNNFVMTLNGHVLNDGLGRLSSWGDGGNIVHQMLVNYQMRALGGEGYLRLMEFLPDGRTVQIKAYSPYLDHYLTDSQNQFILDLDPPSPPPERPKKILFEDHFDSGIPGWTPVQPPGTYFAGPMLWEHDIVSGGFTEQSNIYTDSAASAPSATAVMLINDTVAPASFTWSARLTAGDDDGFGLIFGYQNPANFYRVTFARQTRTGFPGTGWRVDRMVDGAPTVLFGAGAAGQGTAFVNRADVPFDVSIEIDEANRFSLTVTDNPDGAAQVLRLVENKPLPTTADGRVGLMSWGMSGGDPPGFVIRRLQLAPVPLADSAPEDRAWKPIVPPQADGNTSLTGGNGGAPRWLFGAGIASAGVLTENSGAFALATSIPADANTDFTGPSLIAGEPDWEDYSVTTRVIPGSTGAVGLFARWQDASNFYRIVLSQGAVANGGPPRGLSVQAVVGGVWIELFREAQPQYVPAEGVPFDLVAELDDRQLTIRITERPTGLGTRFEYEPILLPETVLTRGKIGLFSWGADRSVFDFVEVEDPIHLHINSLERNGDELTLGVANRSGQPYDVLGAAELAAGEWQVLEGNLTNSSWTTTLPPDIGHLFWRLRQAAQ